MAKKTSTKDTTAAPADPERKAKRRARARSLITGRTDTAASSAFSGAVGGEPQTADARSDQMGRRKALGRIYRVLTDTPADDTGMVDGTPFTQAGVMRLMENLKTRADNEGQSGAKIAARILQVLSPKDGEAEVHGASLKRLQRIAKAGENRGNADKPGRRRGGKRRTT